MRTYLLTCKIVSADRVAELRPAARTPIFDKAGFAHECLESLGFTQGSARWRPWIAKYATVVICGNFLFYELEGAAVRTDEQIDEAQIRVQLGQGIRCADLRGSG